MGRFTNWKYMLGVIVVGIGIISGCSRNLPDVAAPVSVMTATMTPTMANTPTNTYTFTITNTFTKSFTPTLTFTNTWTGTPTFTGTPTNSPTITNTLTSTLSPTPTYSPTSTLSPTVTDTPTVTPTPTNSPTITLTPTMTNTVNATSTPTQTATNTAGSSGCTLVYDCQALVENSYSWGAAGNAALSTSSTWFTTGSQSIDCNVSVGNTWCKIANINSFFPISTTGMTQIIADVDVDASMIPTGTGAYDQLVLQTNAGGTFASGAVSLGAGPQSVTFTVSGSAPSSVNDYEFIYQSSGTPTGNIYLDNIRVVFTGACPTPTIPTYIQGWTFEGDSLTDTVGTWTTIGGTDLGTNLVVSSPADLSNYCADVTATFTAANQTAGIIMSPGTPISGTFTGVPRFILGRFILRPRGLSRRGDPIGRWH